MDCSRSPYFFKIFFPQLSSQQLSIPPAFKEHIKGDAPVTVSLKGPSGRTWYVDLVDNSSFDNGWDEFVADHSIELGDLLVFRYDGDLRFTVLLFDTTACEKKCAFFARPCVEEITVLEKSEGGASFEELPVKDLSRSQNGGIQSRTRKRTREWEDSLSLQGSQRKKHFPTDKTTGKKSQIHATVEKSSCAHNSPHSPRSQPTKNSPSKQITAKRPYVRSGHATPKKSNTAKRPFVRAGVATAKKSNSTKPSRVCSGLATIKKSKSSSCHRHAHESQHSVVLATPQRSITKTKQKGYTRSPSSPIRSYRTVSRVERGRKERGMEDILVVRRTYSTKSKSQRKQVMVEEHRHGSLLSQRRPVTKEEANKALARAKSFKSANPFFITVMREAYVYTSFAMHIPRSFAEENLLRYGEKLTVTLWDSDQKPWPVIFHKYRYTGRFGGGWSKFSYSHNLEQYDVCVFELLKRKHMRVHIFRVVEKLTPLIRFTGRRK